MANVHNTSKFSFSLEGISARGFAEGDALTVAFADENATAYTGTKGEGALVVGSSRAADITVRLQGTSETVGQYIALDKQFKLVGSEGMRYIAKIRSGDKVYNTTGTCLLKKRPDVAATDSMLEIELEFASADSLQDVI